MSNGVLMYMLVLPSRNYTDELFKFSILNYWEIKICYFQ